MSHADIWDDSALIDSWNDALAEYKKYHSIHARGGTLADLKVEISAPGNLNAKPDSQTTTSQDASGSSNAPKPALPDEESAEIMRNEVSNGTDGDHGHEGALGGEVEVDGKVTKGREPYIDEGMLGSVEDEGLKNMMKAWYFAGYYTGLREGQRQQMNGVGS